MQLSGIDKTTVHGFSIEAVDFEKLERTKATVYRNTGNYSFHLRNGDSFEYIRIKDENVFKSLSAGVKKIDGGCIPYAFLDLSIAPLKGNNLVPLSIGAYLNQLSRVFKYIDDMYGITCGAFEYMKFEVLELNATIQLEHSFDKYIRILQTLMDIAPKTYKNKCIFEDRITNSINNLVIKNKSIEVKFYNKSKQMEEVYEIDVDKNLLRIEYTFLNGKKITDVFGSNKVIELTDMQIKNFIIDRFTSDFVNPYYKLKVANRAKLKRLIRQYKADNRNWISKIKEYFWLVESEHQTPVLLDIDDFLELVKSEDNHNFTNNRKRIIKDFPSTYFNQHEKYVEIFNKVAEI